MGSFHVSENLDSGLLGYDEVGLAGGYQRFGKTRFLLQDRFLE
jgi:hypothetical protein